MCYLYSVNLEFLALKDDRNATIVSDHLGVLCSPPLIVAVGPSPPFEPAFQTDVSGGGVSAG